MKKIFLSVCFLLISTADNFAQPEISNVYEITIGDSLRQLHIQARLERLGTHLLMDWEAAGFLPDGWSTYVEGLTASDENGTGIPLQYQRPGKWLLVGNQLGRWINIQYTVNIGHDYINWEEGGHDESAYVLDDLLFSVGRALFITAGQRPEVPDSNFYRVQFSNLAPEQEVSSIWSAAKGTGKEWIARGTHELVGSIVLIGRQKTRRIQRHGVEILLASAGEYESGLDLFRDVFDPLLDQANQVFGPLQDSRFLLTANIAPATRNPYFSGGLLHRSISLITPFVPDESVLPMMEYILFHEYLHIYGHAMHLEPTEMYHNYWFIEGVHDYMSTLLMLGSGTLTPEQFLTNDHGLSGNWNKYLPVAGTVNIREAGNHKFDHYDLIYSGGHIIGAAMDLSFLTTSGGKYDLLQYLREVLVLGQNRAREGRTVSFQDLFDLAVARGGEPQREIFEKYILGKNTLPIGEYLPMAGLKLSHNEDGTPIVVFDEFAPEKAREIRRRYFRRSNSWR